MSNRKQQDPTLNTFVHTLYILHKLQLYRCQVIIVFA